jgi:hypothetical protein
MAKTRKASEQAQAAKRTTTPKPDPWLVNHPKPSGVARPNWREVHGHRWERSDGAVVKWDQSSPYPNPILESARMWTAWEPDPSQRYLGRSNGRRSWPRRWNTPQAAMDAVDREHPLKAKKQRRA